MGFYSPSQLVQDARRHGIDVRAIDITVCGWDSTLEEFDDTVRTQPAVRRACTCCAGMSRDAAERIEVARAIRPFADVADLARRAGLDRADLQVLAAGNALGPLAGHRRQALWEAAGRCRTGTCCVRPCRWKRCRYWPRRVKAKKSSAITGRRG